MTDFTELTPEEQNERLRVLAFKALARYGHAGDVELSLLEHRENAVYKVVIGATGERFALRVHRHGYHTENAIRSELKWMSAQSLSLRKASKNPLGIRMLLLEFCPETVW